MSLDLLDSVIVSDGRIDLRFFRLTIRLISSFEINIDYCIMFSINIELTNLKAVVIWYPSFAPRSEHLKYENAR